MTRTNLIQTIAVAIVFASAGSVAYGQTPVVRSAIINSATKQITIAGTSPTPASGSPVASPSYRVCCWSARRTH
jgi:hypothetical protein